MFLHDIDFAAHKSDFDMNTLTDADVNKRNFAENAATEQVKSFLRKRYDTDVVFITVTDWNSLQSYSEGAQVVKNYVMYVALADNNNEDPEAPSSTFWKIGDNRDPFLVMTLVDMAIYHLFTKIAKRRTPEDVALRYSDALEWLKGVSNGDFIPNYPLLSDDETKIQNEPKYGSETKLNHRW